MSVLSIRPIEYVKFYLHLDRVQNRAQPASSVKSLGKEIFFMTDKAATIAIALLTVALVAFALTQLGESATLMARYGNSCGLYAAPFVAPW